MLKMIVITLSALAAVSCSVTPAANEKEQVENNRFLKQRRQVAEIRAERGYQYGYHTLALLSDPHVKSDLKMSEEQNRALNRLNREFLADLKSALTSANRQTNHDKKNHADDREIARSKQAATRQQFSVQREYAKRAENVLNDRQKRRLVQIKIRLASFDGFYMSVVLDQLELSSSQVTAFRNLRAECLDETGRMLDRAVANKASPSDKEKRLWDLMESSRQSALELLDENQRMIYGRLIGPDISFERTELKQAIRVRNP